MNDGNVIKILFWHDRQDFRSYPDLANYKFRNLELPLEMTGLFDDFKSAFRYVTSKKMGEYDIFLLHHDIGVVENYQRYFYQKFGVVPFMYITKWLRCNYPHIRIGATGGYMFQR